MFDAESPWRFDTGVMIASEIIEVLKQHGVMPSKKLGQNFLCDANVARYHYPRIKPPCSRSVKHLSCFTPEKNNFKIRLLLDNLGLHPLILDSLLF